MGEVRGHDGGDTRDVLGMGGMSQGEGGQPGAGGDRSQRWGAQRGLGRGDVLGTVGTSQNWREMSWSWRGHVGTAGLSRSPRVHPRAGGDTPKKLGDILEPGGTSWCLGTHSGAPGEPPEPQGHPRAGGQALGTHPRAPEDTPKSQGTPQSWGGRCWGHVPEPGDTPEPRHLELGGW